MLQSQPLCVLRIGCNDLLAYMVIMVNEARRFKYQHMMKCSAAKSKSTTWANLNGTLYATTFLSQQKGESVTCRTCSSPDHYTHQCALYDRQPAPYYRSASPPKRKRARSKSPEKGEGFVTHGMMESAHGAQAVDGGTMCA